MIVTCEVENLLGDMRIPDEDGMVGARTQDQMIICVPIQVENAFNMSFKWRLRLHVVHPPKANLSIEASRG